MEIHTLDCPHCAGSGTCTADSGKSCGTCLDAAKLKSEVPIVRCDVCLGHGKTETKTARLAARMPFIIVMAVLGVFYFYAASNAGNEEKFGQIFSPHWILNNHDCYFLFFEKVTITHRNSVNVSFRFMFKLNRERVALIILQCGVIEWLVSEKGTDSFPRAIWNRSKTCRLGAETLFSKLQKSRW